MSGSDRDRVFPALSSATPVRQHDATAAQPLAKDVRDKLESGFGHDFSAVRVHADRESAEQARGMGAQAFTLGRDVHFAAGRYRPQGKQGEQLLAHELAHVVQQERGGTSDQPEQRADAAAARVVDGETVSPALLGGAARSVQMKPDEPAQSSEVLKDKPAADAGTSNKTLDRFGHNSAALTGGHRKALQELAAEIAARVGVSAGSRATITIRGHTDTSGDEKYNEGLGLTRANAAKAALEAALAKNKLGAGRIAGIAVESAGETNPAKQTGDDVKEPLNRRVDILVRIEGPPPGGSTPSEGPSPYAEPEKKPLDLDLPPGYKPPEPYGPRRPPGENSWEKMEENRRRIDELDKKIPSRKPRSATDVIVDGVTKALEPIIKQLPKSLRGKARDGIRAGIEKGTEAGCDAAIDATGVTGEESDAIKAACKEALKTKPGGGSK